MKLSKSGISNALMMCSIWNFENWNFRCPSVNMGCVCVCVCVCVRVCVRVDRDVKRVVESDLGPNIEFYSLMDQCFDFTDREYVYTLCPFDRASQKGRHGGSETSLGSARFSCVYVPCCWTCVIFWSGVWLAQSTSERVHFKVSFDRRTL